jgi:hypothetical protein
METLQRTANRGSISTGYDIENSLKFEPDNSETIQDAHNIAGNKRELTISFWCKITELGTQRMPLTAGARQARIWFDTNDQLTLQLQDAPGYLVKTNRVFRDTSAWYHIVVAIDTTQATDSNRIKLWVNGVQETSWATTQWPPQNFEGFFNVNQSHHVSDPGYYFAGYIADFFFIDDQVLQATDFGEYDEDSGIWIPKEYDGTFSGQSFYLKFDNASDLDERSDGLSNGVSMSLYNITSADQATDTPTNNFCTLNQAAFTLTDATISQGATSFFNTLSDTRTAVATMAVTKGKWYFEYKFISAGGSTYWPAIGFTNAESTSSNLSAGSDSDSSVLLLPNGTPYENGTIGSSNYSYFGANDIAGVALDVDNGNMYLYKNGTIQNSGNPIFTSIGDFIMPLGTTYGNGCGGYFNFGGFTSYTPASPATDENGYGTFEYAPPTGYYALCTKNLAEYG